MAKITSEALLAGELDVGKTTVAEIDAFATDNYVEVFGTKIEKLNKLVDMLSPDAAHSVGPPSAIYGAPAGDAPAGDAPAGDVSNEEVPDALKRRGIKKIQRATRTKAKLPKDAAPALKRRWVS